MSKMRRKPLKSKESRAVLQKICSQLKIEGLMEKQKKILVEEITSDNLPKLVVVNGEIVFIEMKGKYVPALKSLPRLKISLPRVTVDMGAVPHVVNGANVMAPGVTKVSNTVTTGDVTLVIDEKNRVPIAIGFALKSKDEILKERRGPVIKNVHYVGDRIWELTEKLRKKHGV